MVAQPVFHTELATRVERLGVDLQTALEVFMMHSGRPAAAEFLLQRPAGEVEPTPVEVRASFVEPRNPHQDWRGVGQPEKPLLALVETRRELAPAIHGTQPDVCHHLSRNWN